MHLASLHRPRRCLLAALLWLCLVALEPAAAWHVPGLPLARHPHTPVTSPLPAPRSPWWRRVFSPFAPFAPFAPAPGHNATGLSSWVASRPRLLETLDDYHDHVVVRFNVSTPDHEAALRKVVDRMLLDVWHFGDSHVDIRLPARRLPYLARALPPDLRHNHSVLIADLARALAASYPAAPRPLPPHQPSSATETRAALHRTGDQSGLADVFFASYQPLSVITSWLCLLRAMFPARVQMITIGDSYEGRPIHALKVGARADDDAPGRLRETILVTGGMHAREWISVSTVNYLAWSFIQLANTDPMVAKILERFDLVFVPVLNPDGYDYTWEVDRLWRKSRQRTSMSVCPGFDLDHAFGYRWDAVHRQTEPCSQSYGGDEPFQAVEALRLADWAADAVANGTRFVGYLDLHSYSQQVLVPYAYSCRDLPPNLEKLTEVAMNLAKHMRLVNGESYTVASACEGAATSAPHSPSPRAEARGGSAVDYVFHQLQAHYSYQIKLRDTGSYGFLLPSDDIVPTGQEVFQAMKYLGDYLMGNDGHEGWAQREQQETSASPPKSEDTVTELRRRRRGPSSVSSEGDTKP